MGDMTIGIALFVLIIVIGLAIGLRLSATTPQRRAVIVAFGAMAVVATLFYIFAMNASQLWTAPVFAVACIVVPIGAYTLMMRAAGPGKKVVSRRSANEAPKPVRTDRYPRPSRTGSALDATVMPVTPSHPVNEYLSLQPQDEAAEGAGLDASEALEASEVVVDGIAETVELEDGALDAAATGQIDLEPLATGEEAEMEMAPAAVVADDLSATELEAAEPVAAAQTADGGAFSSEGNISVEASADAGEDEARLASTEAFIEEYLVEQNEDEGGLFEPEVAPSLQPKKEPAPVTSTMMVTIPFSEGDERYLVVSESTSVPNPIMAYKRTTSSHLVPLGSAKHASRGKMPLHGRSDAVHEKAPEPVSEAPVFEQTAMSWEKSPAAKVVPAPSNSTLASEHESVSASTPASDPAPVFEPVSVPAPEPESAPAPVPVSAAAPASEPVSVSVPEVAPAPAPTPEPAAAVEPVPESVSEPEPAPEPEPTPAAAIPAERFQEALDKAQSLRDRGLYPVAARLYAEAAHAAPTGDARRHALFEEISCYVKIGQNDKARALAAELRASNVLTRIERIKLDAIERMG